MKRMMKCIAGALTAAITMMAVLSSAYAKTTFDDVIFDLQSLNIMTGDENGDLMLEKNVTRAEFASLTVRMMSMQNLADSYTEKSKFVDVPDDYWAKAYINFLTGLNVISGTSETTFAPEDNIDVSAASKILVCALGYDLMAQKRGGYPQGYLAEASELKILNGVDTTENPLSRRGVARMIYNSLDVDIMTNTNTANGYAQYSIDEGNTFRKKFTSSSNETLTKYTGIVTATANASLEGSASLESGEIEINGVFYEINNESYAEYFGKRVDFFTDGEDSNTIISMQLSNKTHVTTVDAKDITKATDQRFTYEPKKGNSETIKYDKNGAFVYNNRARDSWDTDDVLSRKNGTITFIDNDDDNIADVIIAKEYTSVILNNKSTDFKTLYLKDEQLICGRKFLRLDDDDQKVVLKDADGNILSGEDINDNSVLSCFISDDEEIIEIIVNEEIVSGKVTGLGSDYIKIDGKRYGFEDEENPLEVKMNDEYDFYINFHGEPVYAKKQQSSENYAYVKMIYPEDSGDKYSVKLILPDTIQEKKEEEKDEDGGAAKVISKLACQNKAVIDLPLAQKITINGIQLKSESSTVMLENQIINYSTNSKGEISKIISPIKIGTGRQKYYNSSERTFGKTTGGAFGVDMDTLTICIPKDNDKPTTDDYLTAVEMNNGQLYDVTAYDRDDDTHMAGLIVVNMTMKAGTTGLINTKSKLGMVQECNEVYDEDEDEMFYEVEILTQDGTTSTYRITKPAEKSEDFLVPMAGDLLSYSLNLEYEIDATKILGRMAQGLSYGRTNPRGDYETLCGLISDIEYNQVSENLNRWVHTVSCLVPGEREQSVEYEVLKYSGPPIYIYEHGSKESWFGTIDDIDIANDEIFISAANNSVRAVVILR